MKLSKKQEQAIIDQCSQWYKDAYLDKQEAAGKDYSAWDMLERYAVSGSDSPSQVPEWQADVRVNLIASRIERILGLYTGERPRVTFDPQEPDDALLAEYLTDVCENDWENGGYDRQLREAMQDATRIGTGFWKTWYDVVQKRIRVSRVNPRNMIVDPAADHALVDAEFVGDAGTISLAKLVAKYGEKFLEDDDQERTLVVYEGKTYEVGDNLPSLSRYASAFFHDGFSESGEPMPRELVRTHVTIAQFFLREVATMPWIVDASNSGELAKKAKGWIVTVAANRVVEIKPHITKRQGWHPYDVFRIGGGGNSFWGKGDVYGLVPALDGLDTILSRVCQHTQLVVNPQWKVAERSAHLLKSKLEARPGKMWTVQEINDLEAMRPPSLGGEVLGVIQLLISLIDDRSGVNESVQGRRQAGIESGEHEKALQRQFAERNKPRLDDRNETLKHWGRRYSDLVLEVYTEKHVKRVLGKEQASDWDRLRKSAEAGFDLRIGASPGIDSDPQATVNIVMQQLLPSGILGDPNSPKTKLIALTALRRIWPGADDLIRELRRGLRDQRTDMARDMVAGVPGASGASTAGQPPAQVSPSAPPANVIPMPPQPVGAGV